MRPRVPMPPRASCLVVAATVVISSAREPLSRSYGPTREFDIHETTIAAIHHALREGSITCEHVIRLHLERILTYDLDVATSPPINAFTVLNAHALDQARALDRRAKATGRFVGPLHCVPVVVKDVFYTADMPTTFGALSLADSYTPYNGFPVARLRTAGAIILGKTAIDEFCNGTTGISSRSGKVGNAYDRWENSGGSSSGTAAATAASFAVAGIGTDSCGSIIDPSAFHGLIGIRASVGLVTQGGGVPCCPLDGVAGPIARTVTDAAALLQVLAAPDSTDSLTLDPEARRPPDYAAFLRRDGLRGKRIGLLRAFGDQRTFRGPIPDDVATVHSHFIRDLESGGATVVDSVVIPDFDSARGDNFPGRSRDLDRWLAATTGSLRGYVELCSSEETIQPRRTEAECQGLLEESMARESDMRARGLERQRRNRAAVERVMDEYHLDVLLYPTNAAGPAAYAYAGNCQLTSVSGLPSITVPIGSVRRRAWMPVGVTIAARKWDEPKLIETAFAYEQATRHRSPPMIDGPMTAARSAGRTRMASHRERRITPAILETENARRLSIGRAAFEQALLGGKASDLTADRFRDVVHSVLSHQGTLLTDPARPKPRR